MFTVLVRGVEAKAMSFNDVSKKTTTVIAEAAAKSHYGEPESDSDVD